VSNLVEDFGMVAQAIIVEGSNNWAREVRAIGTTSNSRFLLRTESHLALPAIRCQTTVGQTTIALHVLQGIFPTLPG
jgi:hypothetical protein